MSSWGLGGPGELGWGLTSPWGVGGAAFSSGVTPTLLSASPAILDVEGGTVLRIVGSNFYPEFIPEVLDGSLAVIATGYLFNPDFDLTPTVALAGMPALPAGTYSLRVTTPSGSSGVLVNALIYKPFAFEVQVDKGKQGWSEKWRVGHKVGA